MLLRPWDIEPCHLNLLIDNKTDRNKYTQVKQDLTKNKWGHI